MVSRNMLRAQLQVQVKKGQFVGTSGKELTNYLDCRPLVTNRIVLSYIIMEMAHEMAKLVGNPVWSNIGAVGGPTFAGAHIAHGFSTMYTVPGTPWFAYHSGKGKLILPIEEEITKCIIVDDVLTTGGTLREMTLALINENIRVLGAIVLVDRRDPEKDEMFDRLIGVPIKSIYKMTPDGIIIPKEG